MSATVRSAARALALAAVLAASIVPALAPAPARAESADRDKEAIVVAGHSTLDDLKQVTVLTGDVILTKGTMRLAGDRMEHHQDEQGYQHYDVTAEPSKLASFHERRDPPRPGVESTIDGVAERIEYDERTEIIRLSRHAVVKLFENGVKRDELGGEVIIYDARRSTYEVDGHKENRVVVIIAPSPRPGTDAKKPPVLPLKTDRDPAAAPRP